jgi:hypothetical protein
MSRSVLQACLPWLAALAVALAAAWLLARVSRARLRTNRLWGLHHDQGGSAQSLSFVLTLPLFVMIMLFIIQVSQLMIATVVVHYAAFAAARSAVVWIPAALPSPEGPDCISSYQVDPEAKDQVYPVMDPQADNFGPAQGGVTYLIDPSGPKYERIAAAAVLACMPISPSRDLALQMPPNMPDDVVKSAYATLAPASAANPAANRRLYSKLAYAANNTEVQVRFFHKNEEPPLVTYMLPDDLAEFYFNEVGWQDLVTVTVNYKLALLPGPGRFLSRFVPGPGGGDRISQAIQTQGKVYVYPLHASITIGNEGEKSAVPYVY